MPILYVPGLADCLISVSQLAETNVDILFSGRMCTLTVRRTGALIASFLSVNGLYHFDHTQLPQSEYVRQGRLFTESLGQGVVPTPYSPATSWAGRMRQAARLEASRRDRADTLAYENLKAAAAFREDPSGPVHPARRDDELGHGGWMDGWVDGRMDGCVDEHDSERVVADEVLPGRPYENGCWLSDPPHVDPVVYPTIVEPIVPSGSPQDSGLGGSSPARLWHRRLGHISHTAIQRILHNNAVTGIPIIKHSKVYNRPCPGCLHGRHAAIPHLPNPDPPTIPLQLIQIDITGKHIPSQCNTPYALNAIDYASNYGMCIPIKDRKYMLVNIKHIVSTFIFLGHQHPGKYQIREIRFDNAKEFESAAVTEYLEGLNPPIKISFTAPYEHEQAGKIENYNKILGCITRSMLSESRRPLSLWPYAMVTASYLYNRRVPTGMVVTPIQALTNTVPDLSHLHVWGCTIFCKVPIEIRINKELPCSKEGIFLGYTDTHKTFTVLINQRVQQCRDIVFDETPFPEDPIPPPYLSPICLDEPPLVPIPVPVVPQEPLPPVVQKQKRAPSPITAGGSRPQRTNNRPSTFNYAAMFASPSPGNPHAPVPLPDLPPGTDLPVPYNYAETQSGPYAHHWHNEFSQN